MLIAEGSIEGIADEQVVSERPILFYLDNNVTSYYNLLLQLAKQWFILIVKLLSTFLRVIAYELTIHPIHFYIRFPHEFTHKPHALESHHSWKGSIVLQHLLEVFNVLYLAGLGDSIALWGESPLRIKLHHTLAIFEYSYIHQEAADNRSSPPLPVVAMKHCDSLAVCD